MSATLKKLQADYAKVKAELTKEKDKAKRGRLQQAQAILAKRLQAELAKAKVHSADRKVDNKAARQAELDKAKAKAKADKAKAKAKRQEQEDNAYYPMLGYKEPSTPHLPLGIKQAAKLLGLLKSAEWHGAYSSPAGGAWEVWALEKPIREGKLTCTALLCYWSGEHTAPCSKCKQEDYKAQDFLPIAAFPTYADAFNSAARMKISAERLHRKAMKELEKQAEREAA